MFPDLIVGLGDPDDAAVYRLSDDRALIQTLDFFPPIVDDAYSYGAIAAANALSDVYAMGGEPIFALNICAFPEDLDPEIIADILRGGADKVAEAGAAIAGGHSLRDREPKYGLVVTGTLNLPQLMSKGGASPGDILILTKPIGTGVITTALKREQAADAHVTAATVSMLRLNRLAGRVARDCGVKAATDITGYGLLGHALEMASQAGACFTLSYNAIPLLPGAVEYAEAWVFAGGAETNEMHGRAHVVFADGLLDWQRMLLYDPQTSGGLLLAVKPDQVQRYMAQMHVNNEQAWVIGEVLAGTGIRVLL
jgi:selenide, water dikinase